MIHSIPCQCRIADRECGGELYYIVQDAIRKVGRETPGPVEMAVQCGYCGQTSRLRIERQFVLAIVAVEALPQREKR